MKGKSDSDQLVDAVDDVASSHQAFCDYCGLPVRAAADSQQASFIPAQGTTRHAEDDASRHHVGDTARFVSRAKMVRNDSRSPQQVRYCCLGCKLAAAIMRERVVPESGLSTLTRLGLGLFFAMNVMVFSVALWSWDIYSMEDQRAILLREVFHYACLLFSVPVLLLLGGPLFAATWEELRQGSLTSDALLSLGVLAAYTYSALAVFTGGDHVYFEVGATILMAVTLGRWLEANGKQQATRSLMSLRNLLPEHVQVLVDQRQQRVDIANVELGATVVVMPGERFPLDGELLSDSACVDQQLITGESEPCWKTRGQAIYGGSINGDQEARIQVTAAVAEGTVQRMITAVQQAALAKNRYQQLADQTASWFTPLVMLLALGCWLGYAWIVDFQQGLMVALSVLLIACPCALAIATPLASWTALGEAARHGVLFRHGNALLQLAEVSGFVFDKTGTLTTGSLVEHPTDGAQGIDEQRTAQRVALALARSSQHPLARLLDERWSKCVADDATLDLRDLRVFPGQGVAARMAEGPMAALGTVEFVARTVDADIQDWLAQRPEIASALQSRTHCVVGWQGAIRAAYFFDEQLRPGVDFALQTLRDWGLQVTVLTGDRRQRAERMREMLQVEVQGELLPDDKLAYVRQRQASGDKLAVVGDGINDAPALTAASVGIAMSCGADVTREAAGVCLLGDDVASIPRAFQLALATRSVIRRNLAWAFAYNVVGMGLAVTGRLNPILAAVAMLLSSLYVISNSLRLGGRAQRLWQMARGDMAATSKPNRNTVPTTGYPARSQSEQVPA